MNTQWSAMYKQYGRWTITMPFDSRKELDRHIDLYLDTKEKDYITEIRIIPVTPEWVESLELHTKVHK